MALGRKELKAGVVILELSSGLPKFPPKLRAIDPDGADAYEVAMQEKWVHLQEVIQSLREAIDSGLNRSV
jgi:hypothetical protein